MSSDKTKANHILKRWSADLQNKDRSKSALDENFGELFYECWRASISFKAVEEILPEAIKAHLPSKYIANLTYKKMKPQLKGQTFNEFMDNWKKYISDKATAAFYAQYPIDGVEEEEEKKFGSMSVQEYSKQRKYANSFPVLDTEALKREREEIMKRMEDEDGEV